jgi:FlaG/FlaF family flagellin (archaellin)
MKQYKDHAVSPVVGVMLMLVVTIIIAAVVSGFAGGLVKGQTKVPQSAIQGTFSVTSGLTITNAGGAPIPTSSMLITTTDGPDFGPGVDSYSENPVNLTQVTNSAGIPIAFQNPTTGQIDGYNVTSFNPGDTWYLNITNCNPKTWFQPSVYSSHGTYFPPGKGAPSALNGSYIPPGSSTTWTFYSTTGMVNSTLGIYNDSWSTTVNDAFWNLNFVNPNNIGKSFYLDVHDKATGGLIGQTEVTITG